MKHEEKKKDEDEGPKFDERGEPLVIFKRTCPARQIQFVFGIRPRTARTYAEMEAEAVEVINAAHKKFYAVGKR